MQSRWFDFGGDTIIRTDSYDYPEERIRNDGNLGANGPTIATFALPLIALHNLAGCSPAYP